jgi:K+-transporting ATPase KdpF subunit
MGFEAVVLGAAALVSFGYLLVALMRPEVF